MKLRNWLRSAIYGRTIAPARQAPKRQRRRFEVEAFEDRLAPATLVQSLYPDAAGPQLDGQFGHATATDTSFHVVGMPFADIGGFQDSGVAYVYNATTGALISALDNPSPGENDQFGYSVSVSGNTVVVGAYGDDTGASDSGRAYVFNATTGALIAALAKLSPVSSDYFGFSVSVSGNKVAVGAIGDNAGALDSGQVYVFEAATGALLATLTNPSPASNDYFGYSVSLSGNTVVVGAYQDDTGASNSGQAYVFNAITGALITTLANPSPASSDYFGYSVSLSGNTAVVGAHRDNTGASESGQAYVFDATTGALIAALANPSPASEDHFGRSVSVSGNTVVVGAHSDNTGASNSGQVYVFNAATGALIGALANPSPASFDFFGNSVSVSGNTVVVGAFYDDTEAVNGGQAYSFDASTGALIATLANSSPASGDHFGISVSVSGNTVVVGARSSDNTAAMDGGQAEVFDSTTGALITTLSNPSPSRDDSFGDAVAVSGNMVVVGADRDDTGATDSGAAYVFDATTGALIATLANPSLASFEYFGTQVSVSGNTVVVGAMYADTFSGAAYVFDATTGALIATLTNPSPGYGYYDNNDNFFPGDFFGCSVSVSGNTVVVGASQDDTEASDSGQAYVFDATTGALIATLANPSPATDDRFGSSVSVSGNLVVVGAYTNDTGALNGGQAYVFDATTGSLIDTLANPSPTSDDLFGYSVAVSGNSVVVGAWQDDTQNVGQGAAYVYTIDTTADSDTDSDGISDAIDILPTTNSDDFSDGSTTGTIVSRGDQLLAIVDATDSAEGVMITASAAGGSAPAVISIDGGAALFYINAGDQLIVTHGSVIVHVLAGTVEATFVADSGAVATASLTSGNELTFQPESFVFSVPATNTQPVQILVNGAEVTVSSGQTVRPVQIDIIPGSASNTLNLASNGVISVAILSTTGFDAHTVNIASILFAGAHATQSLFQDVNGDGLLDLVVKFRTQDTTLRSLYETLVADDINEDGVLDSNHETACVSLLGHCQDGTNILGADAMDLFLSGRALRDMLAALAAAGQI